jgi:23S rRNA pseudouridine1911/1915/1917 synthase
MIDAREKLSPVAPPLVDPADLRSWLILEDEHLLVFDKPGWLLCHPSKNGPWSSLGSAVREEFQQDIIRFVYRLDRETSGVIVLARTEAIGRRLQSAVPHRKIGKLYVTLLEGEMSEPVTVDQPLGPDPNVNVTVKQEWLGRRVVGDKLYGPDPGLYLEFAVHGWTARHSEQLSMTRQALHCAAIDLRPTGLDYLLRAPWPADMGRFAEQRMGLPAAEAQRLIDGFVERKLSVGEL